MGDCPDEHTEQAAFVRWCLEICRDPDAKLIYAIPNQGRMGGKRGRMWGARFQQEGLRQGMLDLAIPVARGPYIGLFIEMKRQRGGNISGPQKGWIAALEKAGHRVVVARGALQAINETQNYLRLPRRPL